MLIRNSGVFIKGFLLFVTFLIVLSIMLFANIFDGKNALEASDDLFNSISKGSTYYIPGLAKKVAPYKGSTVEVEIKLKNETLAQEATKLLTSAGAQVTAKDKVSATVKGDLGNILEAALKDSDEMFKNNDSALKTKYGLEGREVLFTWWSTFKEFDKSLKRQSKFKEAKSVDEVVKRGVEVGYNFFGIKASSAASRAGTLTFSLVFYVIYTLWWGIAILLMFEGIGLEMKKGVRKEV